MSSQNDLQVSSQNNSPNNNNDDEEEEERDSNELLNIPLPIQITTQVNNNNEVFNNDNINYQYTNSWNISNSSTSDDIPNSPLLPSSDSMDNLSDLLSSSPSLKQLSDSLPELPPIEGSISSEIDWSFSYNNLMSCSINIENFIDSPLLNDDINDSVLLHSSVRNKNSLSIPQDLGNDISSPSPHYTQSDV